MAKAFKQSRVETDNTTTPREKSFFDLREGEDWLDAWERERNKSRPVLRTIRQLIKALGGREAAITFARNAQSVDNWLTCGSITPGWHWRLEKEMQCRGFELHPRVFGF